MNRRTARRVRNRAPQKTCEKKFRNRLELLSLEVSQHYRHLTGGNVRSFKELTSGRSPPLAKARGVRASRCVRNVGLARVRTGVLQTPKWSDTSVRREAAHKCYVKHRIAELRRGAAEQAKASLQALIPALEERARAAISTGRLREAVEILKRLTEIAAQAPARRHDL
jgi:hypothetical protein